MCGSKVTDDWLGIDPPAMPQQPEKEKEEDAPKGALQNPEDKRRAAAGGRRASRRSLRVDLAPKADGPTSSSGLNTPA